MEIRRVRVANIRSFVRADARLRSGTTLLWGDVGTGKTSLLYAIEMALFGFAEVDGAFLIRHGAKSAEVALTLHDDGHEYTFFRRFSRRTRKGRDTFEPDEKATGLTKDGVTTLYPPTELRRRAIDLLGFPDNPNPRAHSDLWRWAVYVPQERMRQILEPGDSEARLQTVRKALGLERYRTAADNAEQIARSLRRDAEQRTREMALLDHWAVELERQTTRLQEAERAHEQAATAAEGLRSQAKTIDEGIAGAEERRHRRAGEERALTELAQQAEAGRAQGERLLRASTELARRIVRLTEESDIWEAGAANRSASRANLARAERSMQEIDAEVAGLEPVELTIAAAEAELATGSQYEREAEQSFARLRAAAKEVQQRLDVAVRDGPGRAPVAPTLRNLDEIDAAVSSAGSNAERLGGEVRHLEAELAEL
ncbi:MAG: AAA family ATPase, partial [Thermoplasmata archaeon]|nr:AAA family ATPase [Thermoplasmata archaeon]